MQTYMKRVTSISSPLRHSAPSKTAVERVRGARHRWYQRAGAAPRGWPRPAGAARKSHKSGVKGKITQRMRACSARQAQRNTSRPKGLRTKGGGVRPSRTCEAQAEFVRRRSLWGASCHRLCAENWVGRQASRLLVDYQAPWRASRASLRPVISRSISSRVFPLVSGTTHCTKAKLTKHIPR